MYFNIHNDVIVHVEKRNAYEKEIDSENIIRKDDIDFAFGPTWGIQRAYGNLHLLFDVGPVYYFDTKGNSGFFPIALQLNIGFDLKKW